MFQPRVSPRFPSISISPLVGGLTTKKLSLQEKGDDLERVVQAVLEAFQTDGHIVKDYALAKKADYPDFWVLDAKGREWLLECKNRGIHGLRQGGIWLENMCWVKSHILNKAWNLDEYQIRKVYGASYRRRQTVKVNRPIPALITTLMTYSLEARRAIRDFFGDNTVEFVYPTWSGNQGWALELVRGLRRIFTS